MNFVINPHIPYPININTKFKHEIKQKMQHKTIKLYRGKICYKKIIETQAKKWFSCKKACCNFRNK